MTVSASDQERLLEPIPRVEVADDPGYIQEGVIPLGLPRENIVDLGCSWGSPSATGFATTEMI